MFDGNFKPVNQSSRHNTKTAVDDFNKSFPKFPMISKQKFGKKCKGFSDP